MPKISIKDGVISAEVYVEVTRESICSKGTKSTITMQLPEGVTYTGAINVNATCPCCGEAVKIPHGHHYIEGYQLKTKAE